MSTATTHEGFLEKKKKDGKSWKKVWCVVRPGVFSFFSSPTAEIPLGFVSLRWAALDGLGDSEEFSLKNPAHVIRLRAESHESARAWIGAVSRFTLSLSSSAQKCHHSLRKFTTGIIGSHPCTVCGKSTGIRSLAYQCEGSACKTIVHPKCIAQVDTKCAGFVVAPKSPKPVAEQSPPPASVALGSPSLTRASKPTGQRPAGASVLGLHRQDEEAKDQTKFRALTLEQLEEELVLAKRAQDLETASVWEKIEQQKEPMLAELQLRETTAVIQKYNALKAPFIAELTIRGVPC